MHIPLIFSSLEIGTGFAILLFIIDPEYSTFSSKIMMTFCTVFKKHAKNAIHRSQPMLEDRTINLSLDKNIHHETIFN